MDINRNLEPMKKILILPFLALVIQFSFAQVEVSQEFPNPASAAVHISTNRDIEFVEVSNVNGQVLLQQHFNSRTNVELNVSRFEAGMYFVKVVTNEGLSQLKLVVER